MLGKKSEILAIGKTNRLTIQAKDLLIDSKYEFANKLTPLTATESENNTNKLEIFLANNDKIRKINYRDFLQ